MAMTDAEAQRQKEIQQAEELFIGGPEVLGFTKGLFLGRFVSDWVMPYPRIPAAQQTELDQTLSELRKMLDAELDPTEIDRKADIPRNVIDGLGRVGVLGMTAPAEYGGHGFLQLRKTKNFIEVGTRGPAATGFLNAHHSIGVCPVLLFWTDD